MFKHILIPTDGSRLSLKGARAGVKLARALGARVTALYVIAPYVPPMYGEASMYAVTSSPAEYAALVGKHAANALAQVEREARDARVRFSGTSIVDAQPWQGILRAARKAKCDAISMASHGRGGLGGVLLGSETNRVLAHSKIPVLVTR
jgi:nucleotide-binding universal stress UspA family protein